AAAEARAVDGGARPVADGERRGAGARAADANPHLRGVAASRLRGRLRRCSPLCAALGRPAPPARALPSEPFTRGVNFGRRSGVTFRRRLTPFVLEEVEAQSEALAERIVGLRP